MYTNINHYFVHFKYVTILLVNSISIKLKNGSKNRNKNRSEKSVDLAFCTQIWKKSNDQIVIIRILFT